MTPFAQLRRVRVVLAAGVVLRAVVCGAAAAFSLVIGAVLIDLVTPLTPGVRAALAVVAGASGVIVAASLGWRDRAVLSLDRVALWVEERFPALEFMLVTAVETGNDAFVAGVRSDHWTTIAGRRAARVLAVPFAAVLVAAVVIVMLPGGAVARIRSPHPGDALERAGVGRRAAASRLTPLVADVVPPVYSGQPVASIDEPSDVRALVGSILTLRGRGTGEGVVARVGADSIVAATRGDRWSITVRVPAHSLAIRLADRAFERIVAIEAIADRVPGVTLVAPAHDSVVRVAKGRLRLAADAEDDFGIASAAFEYIVSSGEGETFKFRSGTFGAVQPNARRTSITGSISLDSLGLQPGDIVHLRAVARDANNVTGPGVGASETRALRVARAGEYDSVAVEAAAPSDEDKSVISERMLIMLAEALEKRRPALRRDTLVKESHAIAIDQKRLRRTVGEIVFTRLGGDPTGEEHSDEESPERAKTMEAMLARADSATNRSVDPIDFAGGESPVVAVNKPLLDAYNAMWDASTALEIGEPANALPHMRRALAAIQRARLAERVYLRGAPPPVVIDVDKSRLTGKDKGSSSTRQPLTAADSASRARAERFAGIVELASRSPGAAIDSLLVLRIEALPDAPGFAAALGAAASNMRRGKSADAAAALALARRLLAGPPIARDSLTRWGLVP